MAWFILARLLFFVGVTYTATAVQPLPWGVAANAAFGAVLAAVAIVLESRLSDVNVPRILGAVLGAILKLSPVKRLLACEQVKSRYVGTLIARAEARGAA